MASENPSSLFFTTLLNVGYRASSYLKGFDGVVQTSFAPLVKEFLLKLYVVLYEIEFSYIIFSIAVWYKKANIFVSHKSGLGDTEISALCSYISMS